MRPFVTALVTALVLAGALSAQVPRRPGQPAVPEAPPPVPQFKSSVDVVHLDVSVLDRNRRPVRGLKPSDFTILEEGKPQQIAVFEAVDIPEVEPPTASVACATWRPTCGSTPTSRNAGYSSSDHDDSTVQSSGFAVNTAREIGRKVIDGFGPVRSRAVVFTRDNRNAQDFTADRARLRAAVDKFTVGFRDMGAWDPEKQKPMPGQDDGYFIASVNVLENADRLALAACPTVASRSSTSARVFP